MTIFAILILVKLHLKILLVPFQLIFQLYTVLEIVCYFSKCFWFYFLTVFLLLFHLDLDIALKKNMSY